MTAVLIGDQLILEEDYDENYIPSEKGREGISLFGPRVYVLFVFVVFVVFIIKMSDLPIEVYCSSQCEYGQFPY